MLNNISDQIREAAFARQITIAPADRHKGFNTWIRRTAGVQVESHVNQEDVDHAKS